MAGWAETDAATRQVFEDHLAGLARAGVTLLSRRDDPAIEAYERELAAMPELWRALYRYEMRWPMLQYLADFPDKLPPRLKRGIAEGDGLTEAEYRAALVARAHVRALHEELALLIAAAGGGDLAAVARQPSRPPGPRRPGGELGGQPGLALAALGMHQPHRRSRRRLVPPGLQPA